MKQLQNIKERLLVAPISINGTDATLLDLFDLGDAGAAYSEVEITVHFGTMGANASAVVVKEHTTNIAGAGSSAAWISAATAVSGGTFTVANLTSANAANKTFVCYVPVGGTRKRYLGVQVTAGAGATLVSVTARGIPGLMPNTATKLNVVEALYAS